MFFKVLSPRYDVIRIIGEETVVMQLLQKKHFFYIYIDTPYFIQKNLLIKKIEINFFNMDFNQN